MADFEETFFQAFPDTATSLYAAINYVYIFRRAVRDYDKDFIYGGLVHQSVF